MADRSDADDLSASDPDHPLLLGLDALTRSGGTDLHLAVGSAPRLRVDGRLGELPGAAVVSEAHLHDALRSLLSDDELRRLADERHLDFAFTGEGGMRLRCNAFHQMGRLALAIRHIPAVIPAPEQLGMPPVVIDMGTRPHGLVLVTGPTGAGKSTTMASLIGRINATRPCHILTIEDPVEYVHTSDVALVNQRQLGTDTPSFAGALRSALREDPDVVMIGELRDLETIGLALTLAETGHLVIGSLHTNDAAQTTDRIIDVFPPDQQEQIRTQFSLSLSAVVSQRLVPSIGGGRIAAFEVMVNTLAVSNLIRERRVRQLRNQILAGSGDGMFVLEQWLAELVRQGRTTLEDAQSVSTHPHEIAALARSASAAGAFAAS